MKLGLVLGCGFGFLSVALGAFGAHGLEATLSTEMMGVFKTAVQYQMFHSIALLAYGACGWKEKSVPLLFSTGIVLFSGSLYLLAISEARWLGAITPLGGVLFLIGWLLFGKRALER